MAVAHAIIAVVGAVAGARVEQNRQLAIKIDRVVEARKEAASFWKSCLARQEKVRCEMANLTSHLSQRKTCSMTYFPVSQLCLTNTW